MNEQKCRLTIGLPVYNGERYLAKALDSLLAQTMADFRLIISDNGSSDRTEEICREYAAQDSRIEYDRQEKNRGAAWNFNRVFELSDSEYFKWAAADDLCASSFVEQAAAVLDADPGVVCCHSHAEEIDSLGRVTRALDPVRGDAEMIGRGWTASSEQPSARFHDVLMGCGWGCRAFGVMRAATLRETGLMPPTYGAENVMLAELALRGRFHDIPAVLFQLREHDPHDLRTTFEEQQQFVAPESTDKRNPRIRLLLGYLGTIRRSPVGLAEKLRCLGWLCRYIFQISKWKHVARAWRLRQGVATEDDLEFAAKRRVEQAH